MKQHILTAFAIFTLCTPAFTTAQFGDTLLYNGKTHEIFTNPLESYFGKDRPRPDSLFKFSCTACWRGYIATWKIENGTLFFVKAIEGTCDPGAREIDLTSLFGKKPPVEAAWFSGILRIPRGELLDYVHMGYESVYEKELLITIEKGKVVKEEIIDNRKNKLPR